MNRRSFFGSLAALVAGWWGVKAAKAEPTIGVDTARAKSDMTLLIFRNAAGRYEKWPVPTAWLKDGLRVPESWALTPNEARRLRGLPESGPHFDDPLERLAKS